MPPRAAGFYDCRATLNGRDGVEDMNVDFYVHVDSKDMSTSKPHNSNIV